MSAAAAQFLTTAKDTEASQLALKQLRAMDAGASASGAALAKAWAANVEAGKNPSNANLMRRAALAQDAYDHRVSSEKSRMGAAYSLMAAREGGKAISAQQAMSQATTAAQREVLVQQAKFATLRRNVMLQAAESAQKNFKVPALPPLMRASSTGNQEVTLNLKDAWRPPGWVERTNLFFPEDVRVAAGAAGSLAGMRNDLGRLDAGNWWDSFVQHQSQGVLSGFAEAERAVATITSQEPGSAAVAEDAKRVMAQLQPAQVKQVQMTSSPFRAGWWMFPVAAAVAYYFWK